MAVSKRTLTPYSRIVCSLLGIPAELWRWLALITAVWLGAWLRLHRLQDWSFWIDELFTVQNGERLFSLGAGAPADAASALVEHPTTALLVQLAGRLFGLSEWSARLPVALLGVLTIPVLYAVGARLLNRRVGLIAAWLLAISPWHIYWSQNSRFYAPMLLFYTLSLYFLYRAAYRRDGRSLLWGGLFFVWALSERLVALLLLPTVGAYLLLLLLVKWARPAGFRAAWVVGLLGMGGVLGLLFSWEFVRNPALVSDIYLRWQGASSFGLLASHVRHVDTLSVGLGLLGGAYLWRRRRVAGLWLMALALTPVLLLAVAGNLVYVHVRYTFVALTAWFLLAGAAADLLQTAVSRAERPLLWGVLGLLLLFGPVRDNQAYYTSVDGGRNNWRAAFAYLEPELAANDLVAVSKPLLGEYYLQRDIVSMQPVAAHIQPERIDAVNGRVWFVIGGRSRVNPAYVAWVRQHAQLVYTNEKNMFVYRYESGE